MPRTPKQDDQSSPSGSFELAEEIGADADEEAVEASVKRLVARAHGPRRKAIKRTKR